jgi:hypothetical protein
LVMANLDTKTLRPVLNTLKTLLGSQGHLVLSGILAEDEETMSIAARASGLRIAARQSDGEWLCLTLTAEADANRSAPPSRVSRQRAPKRFTINRFGPPI